MNRLADLESLRRHGPLEDAVWLMEYVAKTKGAEHYKSGSRHLHLFQRIGLASRIAGAGNFN